MHARHVTRQDIFCGFFVTRRLNDLIEAKERHYKARSLRMPLFVGISLKIASLII